VVAPPDRGRAGRAMGLAKWCWSSEGHVVPADAGSTGGKESDPSASSAEVGVKTEVPGHAGGDGDRYDGGLRSVVGCATGIVGGDPLRHAVSTGVRWAFVAASLSWLCISGRGECALSDSGTRWSRTGVRGVVVGRIEGGEP